MKAYELALPLSEPPTDDEWTRLLSDLPDDPEATDEPSVAELIDGYGTG